MAREVFQKTNLYTLRLLFLRLRYIIKRGSTTLFCCKMLPAFRIRWTLFKWFLRHSRKSARSDISRWQEIYL